MAVQFENDGASIKITVTGTSNDYERTVQKDEVRININEEKGDVISLRAGKFGDQWNYTDVTAPSSTSVNNLRQILESWLDSGMTDTALLDGAGRQEVALPVVLGDYKFIHDLLPLLMDTEVGGAGTVAHNAATNSARLTVTANVADWAVIQSNQRHQYFSGKAQQPEFTHINLDPQSGVKKMIGYYSSSTSTPFNTSYDGMMIVSEDTTVKMEIYNNGTLVNSVDITNATDVNGNPVVWGNFQVELLDFLYLGGTGLRHFMIIGAAGKTLIDKYDHSNTKASLILRRPNQPIRAEIRSTGGAGSFDMVCAQVTSSGDQNQQVGVPTSHDTGNAKITLSASGTTYAMIGVRLKSTHLDTVVQQQSITAVADGASDVFIWRLHLNPTVTIGVGGWSFADVANTGIQIAKGDGNETIAVNDYGHILASGTGAGRTGLVNVIEALRKIGSKIDGTQDEIVLSMTPLSANQNVALTLTTTELQ